LIFSSSLLGAKLIVKFVLFTSFLFYLGFDLDEFEDELLSEDENEDEGEDLLFLFFLSLFFLCFFSLLSFYFFKQT
jgi:hypothetical protein